MEGKPGVAASLMPFLQKWLLDHTMHSDKEYDPFLNEKGIHRAAGRVCKAAGL